MTMQIVTDLPVVGNSVGVAQLICKKINYSSLAERCESTTTMSQLSPNRGATNGDHKCEMVIVRDNRATNKDDITTTPQLTFHP